MRSRRTAIHEAGHAVIALDSGLAFDRIQVMKDEANGRNGILENLRCIPADSAVAKVSLGGIMACRLDRSRWDNLFDLAFDDIGMFNAFYERYSGRGSVLEWDIRWTEKLLLENWGAVLSIATVLMKAKTISYDDARNLFDSPGQETPRGRLGKKGWQPLIDNINWRREYPNGIVDVFRKIQEEHNAKHA